MTCFSIGYEGRSVADFCDSLIGHQVDLVLDVRERAWSQRPHFRKAALSAALEERGIRYAHCPAAGNPFRPRPGEDLSFEDCAAKYATHLSRHPRILEMVEGHLRDGRVALLCYEARRDRCHRGVLLDALRERRPGLDVVDL